MTTTDNRIYSVWVGDVEINDHYLTWSEAHDAAQTWIDAGYDDVLISAQNEVTA